MVVAVPASAASAKAKALIFMMPRSNPRLRDDQIYARGDSRGRTRVCFEPVSNEPVLLCVFCALFGVRSFSAGPPTGWEGLDFGYLQLTGARDLNAGRSCLAQSGTVWKAPQRGLEFPPTCHIPPV